MARHIFTFLATFAVGAIIALAARTATHQPHADHAANANPSTGDYAPLVTNTPTDPHAAHKTPSPSTSADESKTQNSKPKTAPANDSSSAPVNTVCAICGMDVDPKLPTLEYQGKKIGFGCRMCPPKFKAEPDKYGPFYLRNEVIKR
jgi:hypothetical protein